MFRQIIERVLDIQLERVLGTLVLAVVFVVMVGSVIMRYGFGLSLSWYEEFGRYGMILLAVLAIGAGFKNRSHIAIDNSYLPAWLSRAANFVTWIISILFVGGFAYYALMLADVVSASRSPAMQIPMSWVYLAISCIAFLGVIRLLERAFLRRGS